jgi:hypothetical protein
LTCSFTYVVHSQVTHHYWSYFFASWTKIYFDPFKWYFNDIGDYMGVQSIFGLFLQLNWKETTPVTSWKNISRKQKFNHWKNTEKTGRYDRIINELCHFYKVSLIKTGLMFHKYHLLNQLQVLMSYLWFDHIR